MPDNEKNTNLPGGRLSQGAHFLRLPMKRIWAWVGVAYMVIIVFLMTYMYAKGVYLNNIASLMVIPALGGGLPPPSACGAPAADTTPPTPRAWPPFC